LGVTQSQQPERKLIAVDFRGIQQASRERTACTIIGRAGLTAHAALPEALPVMEEQEEESAIRQPPSVVGSLTWELGGEAARAAYAYASLGGLVELVSVVGVDQAGDTAI
jgi:hypothetical protein